MTGSLVVAKPVEDRGRHYQDYRHHKNACADCPTVIFTEVLVQVIVI
jgi:hypothetical protein